MLRRCMKTSTESRTSFSSLVPGVCCPSAARGPLCCSRKPRTSVVKRGTSGRPPEYRAIGVRAHFPEHGESVELGHEEVEQDDRRRVRLEISSALRPFSAW